MRTPDELSTYVADLLEGTYDCVDRITLRGYYPLGQTSGGLLTWWNQLFSNTPLTEERLRKLAGDFGRRVDGYASKHKIPLRYFASRGERQARPSGKASSRGSEVSRGVCHLCVQSVGAGLASQKQQGGQSGPAPAQELAVGQSLPFSHCRPRVGTCDDPDERPSAVWLADIAQWA